MILVSCQGRAKSIFEFRFERREGIEMFKSGGKGFQETVRVQKQEQGIILETNERHHLAKVEGPFWGSWV